MWPRGREEAKKKEEECNCTTIFFSCACARVKKAHAGIERGGGVGISTYVCCTPSIDCAAAFNCSSSRFLYVCVCVCVCVCVRARVCCTLFSTCLLPYRFLSAHAHKHARRRHDYVV